MRKAIRISIILSFLALFSFCYCKAQNVAVKTNLLYDATANANLGIEGKLAPKWSLDVSGDFNDWTIHGHKWKHWFVQPEARYWFCEAFLKHFIGLHVIGGQYNVGNIDTSIKFLGTDFSKLKDHRYQGWGIGGGVAYGYALPLSKHWNMEFEIGIGYVYLDYDIFQCQNCGRKVGRGHHNYFGPTKAAVNLVYIF
ncbi:MAG: DUF3575 domain-containing protein [Muribaculaceae bacterium]|nr:DUF3575 domain-containing protein [Muribaculaceae bacterium]